VNREGVGGRRDKLASLPTVGFKLKRGPARLEKFDIRLYLEF
jgi:hypothetical protein